MTGVWMTVPPALADRLSDEARSFANEFAPNQENLVARADQSEAARPIAGPEAETRSGEAAPPPPHDEKLR